MKTFEINGHLREEVGKKNAKNLRREGMVPCVIYGGESNIHFYADERELNKLIYTGEVYVAKFNLNGSSYDAVIRDSQFHPVSDKLLHMDFVQVFADRPVTVSLPVRLSGVSIGVKNGGTLRHNAKKLKVKGMLTDLPDALEIDITRMRIGTSKKVAELNFKGLSILEADNRVVVAVKTSRKAIAETEEEEAAEGGEGAEAPAEEAAAES